MKGIFFAEQEQKRGAGGHFWHDEVLYNDTMTPAKWILLDAT
jgi:hypothetical protein